MAEWSMAAVLKTVDRKVRGFESCSLRQNVTRFDQGLIVSSSGIRRTPGVCRANPAPSASNFRTFVEVT